MHDSEPKERNFRATSQGIRVTVRPSYLVSQSEPASGRYVFVYRIRIENLGGDPVQLIWRHWHIHDPTGGDTEVEGEGVVGQQPVIAPGEEHEYESFCVLAGPHGHMEGFYEFMSGDGPFRATIPRFLLLAIPE
jgi:ApaG protein